MASLDLAPAGGSSPCIRLRRHDALVRAGRRDSALSAWPHRLSRGRQARSASVITGPASATLVSVAKAEEQITRRSRTSRKPAPTRELASGLTLPLREGPAWSSSHTAIRENYLMSLLDTDDEHGLATGVWPVLSTRGEKEL